jgi:hypothetical protein
MFKRLKNIKRRDKKKKDPNHVEKKEDLRLQTYLISRTQICHSKKTYAQQSTISLQTQRPMKNGQKTLCPAKHNIIANPTPNEEHAKNPCLTKT